VITVDTNSALPGAAPKKKGRLKKAAVWGILICVAVGVLFSFLFPGAKGEELEVSLGAPVVDFFGLSLPSSAIFTWGIIAALFAAALVLRFAVIPKFSDHPGKIQTALEVMVEYCENFTKSRVGGMTAALAPYVFTVAVYIIAAAATELFGLRPPTADITVTFSLSIIVFFLINYFGIKANGLGGRLRQFVRPKAFMIPFKIIGDCAIPVSLACRLFGNMLGGMIVIDLLYMALGNYAAGAPAVLGLYFNLFHPLIQTFIFLNLALSFIEEAID